MYQTILKTEMKNTHSVRHDKLPKIEINLAKNIISYPRDPHIDGHNRVLLRPKTFPLVSVSTLTITT